MKGKRLNLNVQLRLYKPITTYPNCSSPLFSPILGLLRRPLAYVPKHLSHRLNLLEKLTRPCEWWWSWSSTYKSILNNLGSQIHCGKEDTLPSFFPQCPDTSVKALYTLKQLNSKGDTGYCSPWRSRYIAHTVGITFVRIFSSILSWYVVNIVGFWYW